jgi:aspartyl-tRNA(Asn)/glutamyl-tRNA(Gln) amidotransferase subunit B
MTENSTISNTAAKQVFEAMFENGKSPVELVSDLKLEQISDETAIAEIVRKVIGENLKSADDYRAGKDKALDFIVGQTMKASKGKGNPELVKETVKKILDGL